MKILNNVLRVIVAFIYLQTLFFKFSGASESVYIFEQLGAEPFGRIASGIAELVVAGLILVPKTRLLGALGSVGVISGAVLSHVFVLGIEVQGDGGLLFGMAVFILSASLWLVVQDIAIVRKIISQRRLFPEN